MRVHNITGHPSTPGTARAMRVGGMVVRPGKVIDVPKENVGKKIREFHGSALWFGTELPENFRPVRAEPATAAATPPMTTAEARVYLEAFSDKKLREMALELIPPIEVPDGMARIILIARFARALFHADRFLDPQEYFWLRRWVKRGDTYIERE